MTNLDKIKELTAEELADWIFNIADDFPPWCDESRGHHGEAGGCEKCMVDWLKESGEERRRVTNADKIRAMNDKELLEFIQVVHTNGRLGLSPYYGWDYWLKKEAEEWLNFVEKELRLPKP